MALGLLGPSSGEQIYRYYILKKPVNCKIGGLWLGTFSQAATLSSLREIYSWIFWLVWNLSGACCKKAQVLLVFLTRTKLLWMPVDWAMAAGSPPNIPCIRLILILNYLG